MRSEVAAEGGEALATYECVRTDWRSSPSEADIDVRIRSIC